MSTPTANEIKQISECIRAGRPPSSCCRSMGISTYLMNKWLREGAQPACTSTMVQSFSREVGAAQAEVEMALIDEIRNHTRQDWKASDRLLKIMNPGEYNEEVKLKMDQQTTVTHKIEIEPALIGELISSLGQYASEQGIINGVYMGELGTGEDDDLLVALDDIIDVEVVEG